MLGQFTWKILKTARSFLPGRNGAASAWKSQADATMASSGWPDMPDIRTANREWRISAGAVDEAFGRLDDEHAMPSPTLRGMDAEVGRIHGDTEQYRDTTLARLLHNAEAARLEAIDEAVWMQGVHASVAATKRRAGQEVGPKMAAYHAANHALDMKCIELGIPRPIAIPDWSRQMRLAFGIVAVEALFTAWLFQEAADFGLLGGAMIGCIVSALNLVVGLATGATIPHIAHVDGQRRLLARIGLGIGLLLGFSQNLYVAQWRSSLAASAASGADSGLLGDPLGMLLLVVGLVIFGVATLKGALLFRNAGIAAPMLAVARAEKKALDGVKQFSGDIDAVYRGSEAGLDARLAEDARTVADLHGALTAAMSVAAEGAARIEDLNQRRSALVAIYVDQYRRHADHGPEMPVTVVVPAPPSNDEHPMVCRIADHVQQAEERLAENTRVAGAIRLGLSRDREREAVTMVVADLDALNRQARETASGRAMITRPLRLSSQPTAK